MFAHETNIRVRYAETDQMGYVYYGAYAAYYEVGRVESLRQLGISYKELEAGGVIMPVLNMESRFIRPAYYDDLLIIRSEISKIPEDSITFNVEIYNQNRKIINQARVKLCFINKDTNERITAPELLIKKLTPYFGRFKT
jgi:acyl-CoA thioester hydrolase